MKLIYIGWCWKLEQFARRLKACRERKKAEDPQWTQRYVAEQIGMARTTYTAYENGTKMPPADTINHIATLLDVSNDYLMGRTNERTHYGMSETQVQLVPVVRRLNAHGHYDTEDVVKWSPVERRTRNDEKLVWLLVQDNEMIQAGIRQNSQVLIRFQSIVESGDIAAISIGYDEVIVRKVYCNEQQITVVHDHASGTDEVYRKEEVTIIGKVLLVQSPFER